MTNEDSTPGAEGSFRSPAEVRRDGNRLATESSAYLRQHATNPVDWFPWNDEALARARDEDKPIFLSIGYASCHWCHVMEREVFAHDDVAEFLNHYFVCIKVDREERPDLDSVYLAAVQTMIGKGGWPLSVFLTPDLKPFFGATYFPHDKFLELVGKIREIFLEKRNVITFEAARLAEQVTTLPTLPETELPAAGAGSPIADELIATAAAQATANFDLKWAGFTGDEKFPSPIRWQFLLHHFRRTGDAQIEHITKLTLEAMASGGIYDHVGGGFHRYAVEKTWLLPHFEKMLYDNAQLASLYLEAGMVMERADFLAVGKDVLDFLLRDLQQADGGFAGSIDADCDGEEGIYYVWTPDDLIHATDASDGPVLAQYLGVESDGNFDETRSILTRRTDPAKLGQEVGRAAEDIASLFQKHRQALRQYREGRLQPTLDRKLITAWNGLAITAMAQGYAVTRDASYLAAAERAAEYLWRVHHRGEGRLYRSSTAGTPSGEGVLDDYACLANGLVDLSQVTGKLEYLQQARSLVEYARINFARDEGGYYLSDASVAAPLGRKIDIFDSVMPSGNAALMMALLRLGAVTGNQGYRREVERALGAFAPLLARIGLEMAGCMDVATRMNGPYFEVIVAGDPGDEAADRLERSVLSWLPVHLVLTRVPATGLSGEAAILFPPLAGKTALADQAAAHVCEFGICGEPITDPNQLRERILSDWLK